MKPLHGTGEWPMDIVMCKVELRARIREQLAAARVAKLKYRGLAAI